MRARRGLACGLVAIALLGAAGPGEAAEETPRPQVMILGTFHFGGSTQDVLNLSMGDLTTAERQLEIEEIVDRLARFAPTKIMVELAPEHEADFNATYQSYLAGEHELTPNERQQLGMRLAKKLGHDRLYAVDHRSGMDFDRMMAAGQAAGQEKLIAGFQATMQEVARFIGEVQGPDDTVLDALRVHNSQWAHDGNSIYLQLALLGSTDDPAGAEVVGGWYRRNLAIYANIARAIEGPEDRVLVIYGSGHLAQLASFFDQNPDFDRVSALEVLGEPE